MNNARRKGVETFVLVIPMTIWIMVGALTLVLKNLKVSWPCLEQSPSNVCKPVKSGDADMMRLLLLASTAMNKTSAPSNS